MKRRSLLSLLLASSAGSALAGGRWSSGGVGFPRSRSVLVLLELRGRPGASFDPEEAAGNAVLRQLPSLAIPRGSLGQQVALALRLIGSGACPPVLQLAQGGYDTHANQATHHGRVLSELAAALVVFAAGLERLPNRPAVTLLAVSEFGQPPAQKRLPRHRPRQRFGGACLRRAVAQPADWSLPQPQRSG